MIKKFAVFVYKLLSLLDKIINILFKKNVIIHIADCIHENSYKKLKILNRDINFFVPNSICMWRVNSFFKKEPETLQWINEFSNNEKTIFWDIGSNIGLYSIYNAIKNPLSLTVSFEPSTSNLRVLSRNISINNLGDRIKLFTNPISNHENKFLMMNEYNFNEGVAMNTFGENFDFEGKKFNPRMKYQLLGTSLNYLISNKILEKPNYVKIDVDGIEHLILKGGDIILKNSSTKSFLIEINENFEEQYNSIIEIMTQNNFSIKSKHKAYNAHRNKKFSNTYNYIFIK